MGKTSLRWALRAVMAAAVLGVTGCDDASCSVGDRTYEDGEHWTCADGCNECSCSEGTIESTAAGCLGPPGPAAGKRMCFEGDVWRKHDASWTCADGCTQCSCSDGEVAKSAGDCPPS